MISKKEVLEKLHAKLTALSDEELVYLHNFEFVNKFADFKVLKVTGGKIIKGGTEEVVEREGVVISMIKVLVKENKNHALVMIFNSVSAKDKIKYTGEGNFESVKS
jgi:hypothetical protein